VVISSPRRRTENTMYQKKKTKEKKDKDKE
jgi:hypothetical protein